MLVSITRTIILYLIIVMVLRLMGKRQVGQLQPFELVVILMISELAAIPSQDNGIPLLAGLLPVLVLLLMSVMLSFLTLKSEKARSIVCGSPTIVINKGQILEDELRKLRYNLSDLLEQLRVKNVPNIADVEYAILETNGQLSVIPKSTKRPLTPEDMKVNVEYNGMPFTLIMDGIIQHKNFERVGISQKWLEQELKKANVSDYRNVLIASIDAQKKLFIQQKKSQEQG